jgi:uncharacterized protein (TIGR03067 family)
MRAGAQWLTVMLAAALLGAEDADQRKALDGTWHTVSLEVNGQTESDDDARQYEVVFAKDKFTVNKSGQPLMKGALTVDAAAVPARIDLKIEENTENPDDVGKTLSGIYQITGDELKWCFGLPAGAERPKEFKTEQDSGRVLATLKRQKKL